MISKRFGRLGKLLLVLVISLTSQGLKPLTPAQAASASLYVSPGTNKVNVGQTLTLSVFVRTDQAINAGSGEVILPDQYLQATSLSKSGSIFSIWTAEPTINGNKISFGGGLSSPGYNGSGGKLFSFTLKAKQEGTVVVTVSNAKILANDGKGTDITSGSGSATVTIGQNLTAPVISSSTHPDQSKWYQAKTIDLNWSKPSGVQSFQYTFGRTDGSGTQTQSLTATSTHLAGDEGSWIFNLTAKFNDGKTTDASFRINIDATAPDKLSATASQANGPTDPYPILTIDAHDERSGIDHFQILIDGQDPIITTETTYKLPRQTPGKRQAVIKAFDKAGNVKETTVSFEVEGFPGPVITSYPKYVSLLQPITVKGMALFGAKVILFVDNKQVGELLVKEHLTEAQQKKLIGSEPTDDQSVEWIFELGNTLKPGAHQIYAIQIKADQAESNPSNTISTKIVAGSIALFGLIIPSLLIVLVLTPIFALLLMLIIWLWHRLRVILASWRKKSVSLRDQIDVEMNQLEHRVDDKLRDNQATKTTEVEVDRDIGQSRKTIDRIIDTTLDGSPEGHHQPDDKK